MNIKNKNNSIQYKTMKFLILFSIMILIILWFSQILFLKIFYEKYQINNLIKIEELLKNNIYTIEEIETIAYENNMCIEYINKKEQYVFNGLSNNCILSKKNTNINNILNEFIVGKENKQIIKLKNPENNSKSIIYSIKYNNGFLFLNTSLEDVNSTTSVLRSQLIYITLIVIILAIVISIYLSKMLNDPIVKITKEAKKLSKGNKILHFEKSNIYEIDELTKALEYANKEINKTDELRRDLLANVSHDLKTPLTMIKAYAEMTRDLNNNKEKNKENLNIIIEETDRLTLLVNDILELSKLESNYEKLEQKEFDLVPLVKNIIKKYNIIKETEHYKFKQNLPKKALVYGDSNKISQVIYNLVNNAINYTGEDLTVTIEIIEKEKTYVVNIKDTGKGIKDEDINLIWNKYYKNEKNHKRDKIGTGIGLSIVKNILDNHKLNYGVYSEINKGTTFYFEINKIS